MIPLSFAGDARAIGLEEGKTYRDSLERIIWGEAIPDIWSANPRIKPLSLKRAILSAAPHEVERIEAICSGAVLDPLDLLSIYTRELAVTYGLCPPATSLVVAASDDRFEGGGPAVGVDIDVPIFLLPFIVARRYEPRDSRARIEVSLITLAGTLIGINEQGLAVALSLKPFEGGTKGLLPLSVVVREALVRCKDAKGALKVIESFPRGASGTIVIADPRSIIIVETTPRALEAKELKKGFFIGSAHFLLPDMMSRDLPHLTQYPETAPSELIGKGIFETSEGRVDRAFDLVNSQERWDAHGLGEVLLDREHGISLSSGFYKTAVSALLVPAKKTLFLATSKKGKFSRIFL